MTSWHDLIETAALFAPVLRTAAAVGVAASCVGTFVLLRRQALLALALPQAVAVGAAVGFRLGALALPAAFEPTAAALGWPTLPPALLAAALFVVLMSSARLRAGGRHDPLLPSLYVGGLCVSLLVVAGSGQHLADLQNLYTGIDVAVDDRTERLTIPLVLAAGLLAALLWRRWLLLAQAPAAAELTGLRPARWDALFLSLLAAVVLLGMNALGTAMVLAMLFLPAAAALPWTRRIPPALLLAAGFSLAFLVGGFVLSLNLDWPLSQSVGAVGVGTVLLSHLLAAVRPGV